MIDAGFTEPSVHARVAELLEPVELRLEILETSMTQSVTSGVVDRLRTSSAALLGPTLARARLDRGSGDGALTSLRRPVAPSLIHATL